MGAESQKTPLSALLSYALVAFTIELDNAAEQRIQHRTANFGSTGEGPWLASGVMWFNCMKYVDEAGITLKGLLGTVGVKTNFHGMVRWGYVTIDQSSGKGQEAIIRATKWGMKAREVWQPLFSEIEDRWRSRFGVAAVSNLRRAAIALLDRFDYSLPDCLPILGPAHFCATGGVVRKTGTESVADRSLYSLLSKLLLGFALLFEKESEVSLATSANVLRLVPPEGMALRELPIEAGVSKESVAMAETFLANRGYGQIARIGGKRWLTLTPKGVEAKETYSRLVFDIEKRWQRKFGKETVEAVRTSLEPIVGDGAAGSPLFQGLVPGTTNWRAKVKRPRHLPDFPMVLHRGGYPDGS